MSAAATSSVLRGQEHLVEMVLPGLEDGRAGGQAVQALPLEALKLPAGQTLQTPRSPAKPASHEATQDPPGTSGPSFCPGS
jgi:hypothetical protein